MTALDTRTRRVEETFDHLQYARQQRKLAENAERVALQQHNEARRAAGLIHAPVR